MLSEYGRLAFQLQFSRFWVSERTVPCFVFFHTPSPLLSIKNE
jgi:hypothetical protein